MHNTHVFLLPWVVGQSCPVSWSNPANIAVSLLLQESQRLNTVIQHIHHRCPQESSSTALPWARSIDRLLQERLTEIRFFPEENRERPTRFAITQLIKFSFPGLKGDCSPTVQYFCPTLNAATTLRPVMLHLITLCSSKQWKLTLSPRA